jgi:hypothetical protein
MASLWVFLGEQGVEPTNNRAERSWRLAVRWRKGSSGTGSGKGNHWVEQTLSLRQTCRQLGQSTFGVLLEAVTSLFQQRNLISSGSTEKLISLFHSPCGRVPANNLIPELYLFGGLGGKPRPPVLP